MDFFFNLSTFTIITILSEKGQNTETKTFLHVNLKVVRSCLILTIRIVLYGQNGHKTFKKWPTPRARKIGNQHLDC